MKVLRAAALLALLIAPAHAQQMPDINLIPDTPSKTPEEKAAEEARDKAYRETLKTIPDAKASNDPWGGVRADTPKAASPAAVKPRPKTRSTAN